MIHKDAELLTRQGWSGMRSGEIACIQDGRVVWSPVEVSGRFRGSFCHVYGRYFGVCVDAYHPVPAIRYASHINGSSQFQLIEANSLSTDWVLLNTFNTDSLPGENPYLACVNSFNKSSDIPPVVGQRSGDGYYCGDDIQFRLIPDVMRYRRFESLLRWHGRDYVEDMNAREMRGTCEFSNYSESATDVFELSALGAGKRVERLSPRRLRTHDRWCLRVDKLHRFHDYGYSLKGNCDFVLTRYQGKIGIVGLSD